MRQSLEILNVFNTLTLNQISRKTQTLGIKIDNAIFPYKNALSEVNFEKIEWGVQNEPLTTNEVLPLIISFFKKFSFRFKSLI